MEKNTTIQNNAFKLTPEEVRCYELVKEFIALYEGRYISYKLK